jgi:hypothetical protein
MEVIAVLRDLVIILSGIIWFIAGILVVVIGWITLRFVKSLPRRTEVVTAPAQDLVGQAKQAVGAAGEGARTAREAITFVSEKAVAPTIAVASAAVGVRRFIETLVGGVNGKVSGKDRGD